MQVVVVVITDMLAECQETALCRHPYRTGGNEEGGVSHNHNMVSRKVPGGPTRSSKVCIEDERDATSSSDEEELGAVLITWLRSSVSSCTLVQHVWGSTQ